MKTRCSLTLLMLFCLCAISSGRIIRVPQDSVTIQGAINAAGSGDTVLVADGTYYENLIINKGIALVSIFILDGDKDHINRTIIDGSQPSKTDTASVIIIGAQSDSNTVVQGFTIQRGKGTKVWCTADNTYWLSGGGIYMEPRSVRILNNRIINNTLTGTTALKNVFGGGISIGDYSGLSPHAWTIADNLIANNSIIGFATEDAGISVTGNGIVSKNIIIGNSCTRDPVLGSGSVYGGGVTVRYNAIVTIENNYIAKNNALHNGSALYFHAFNNLIPYVIVKNNIIAGNKVLDNTIGGTLMIRSGQYEFINNTIVDNSGGTVFRVFDNLGPLSIKTMNNVCYNAQIAGANEFSFAQTTAVQKFYSAYNFTLSNTGISTNIYGNPLFVAGDTLYRLQSSSPAVAHGAVSASVGGTTLYAPAVDYQGNARPSPSWSKPDMGAVESPYALTGFSAVHRVPQDFAAIQNAINAAGNGDLVLVSDGTYKENLVINKKITLSSLYYLDNDTSHISKTILDGSAPTHPDTASVINILLGCDTNTVITGFTITKGAGSKIYASNNYWLAGGGICIRATGLTIRKNRIIGNNTIGTSLLPRTIGGGVCMWPSDPLLNYWIVEENIFIDNETVGYNRGTSGGALSITGSGRLLRNTFINNTAQMNPINTNSATSGGAIELWTGTLHTATVTIDGNLFKGNKAIWGSAIVISHNSTVLYNYPVVTFQNNIVTGNVALTPTSGIMQINGPIHLIKTTTNFINNTISDNTGNYSVWVEGTPSAVRLLNNIIWNPSAGNYQLRIATTAPPTAVNANYNCLYGGFTGTGNINADPLFAPSDTLFRLSSLSPAICGGIRTDSIGSTVLFAPSIDYLGTARPRPAGTRCDMGAIEHDSGKAQDPRDVRELSADQLPETFMLSQNYPNPFNPSTTIRYALPQSAKVKLAIYDLLGQEITTLVDEGQSAGWKEVVWNAKNVSSGIYFYSLQADNFNQMKKMVLIK